MHASFLNRTLVLAIAVLLLPVAAWAQNGPTEPGRVDIQTALNFANRIRTMGTIVENQDAAVALGKARNAALDAFNVEAMLEVARAYEQTGNLDMMDSCLEDAYGLALAWAINQDSGALDPKGANFRYGHRMLGVIGSTKLPVRARSNGEYAREKSKRAAADMTADLRNQMPQVFKGPWRTGERNRDLTIEQVGNRLRGSIGAMEFKVEITGINGDVVTAEGEYTAAGASGKVVFTLNLARSNHIEIVMTTPTGNTNRGTMNRP